MTINTVPTFTATIYVGLKERYNGEFTSFNSAKDKVQTYCDVVGLCVTLTPTEFVYTNGSEPGLIVGLINYPRFPSSPELIRSHALALAEILLKHCKQMKVSVVMPNETVMVSIEETRKASE